MPDFKEFHVCDAGWKLYLDYCDIADSKGADAKKEARKLWSAYLKHRRTCSECTGYKKHKRSDHVSS